MEHQWNEIDRGKPTTRRKTCPSATLSTTNLTWTDPGSNPGLRSERSTLFPAYLYVKEERVLPGKLHSSKFSVHPVNNNNNNNNK
jgi:hypothetical protein